MAVVFLIMLGVIATSLILAVMFAPDERLDDEIRNVRGEPLALAACPRPVHQPMPQPRPQVHKWDSIDQHWGEAHWMLTTG